MGHGRWTFFSNLLVLEGCVGDFLKVALVSDLEPGQGKTVERRGIAVALFNVGGTFRAIGNACLHRGGPLAEGELKGTVVTCPWHGWQFDVISGAVPRNPDVGVPIYRVVVRGDEVFVEFP
jgi:nitrite reductase (NADH) small subunit/3-phenylpropionate/trans-cinnamate dioxygenase ferredoxin subunit